MTLVEIFELFLGVGFSVFLMIIFIIGFVDFLRIEREKRERYRQREKEREVLICDNARLSELVSALYSRIDVLEEKVAYYEKLKTCRCEVLKNE